MTTIRPKVFKPDEKQRLGRGFSRGELKKAGSSLHEAVKLGVPVDEKRKTAHEENVEAVKTLIQQRRPAPKPIVKIAAKPAAKPKKPKKKTKN